MPSATGEPRALQFEVRGLPLATLNQWLKGDNRGYSERMRIIRDGVHHVASSILADDPGSRFERVKVGITYCPPDDRKRDAINIMPSVKAAVDGLVNAGIIPDDDDSVVLQTSLERGETTPGGNLVIRVTEVG